VKICLAHGNGGRETAALIDRCFMRYFGNDILRAAEDAAAVSVMDARKIAVTTDSFVVDPLFFKGGDIGRLCVCGTVNDLLMSGAEPAYITAAFIIEQGFESDDLERISRSIRRAAEEAGVVIAAADTKVIEARAAPGLCINTSGVGVFRGSARDSYEISAGGALPGDAVILSGTLGDHHACILSSRLGIENDIRTDAAPLGSLVKALRAAGIPVHAMRDITRGGLATVLNEIARASRRRIDIYEWSLPVSVEVRGLCGILGLDPLYMGNEGKLAAFVPWDKAEAAVAALRQTEYGKNAVAVGRVSEGEGVVMETEIGGKRLVDTLSGEGLPRIC